MTIKTDYSHLTASDSAYIDSMYETFKDDPKAVDETWQMFFNGFEYKFDTENVTNEALRKEFNVYRLIQSYRARGHLLSDTNPVRARKDREARLELAYSDLEESDLDREFDAGNFIGLGRAKLSEIINHLKRVYCYKIGIEYYHSNNSEMRRWVRDKFEAEAHTIDLPNEQKKNVLHKLNQAAVFEQFLQTKYVGQKRFSLEGGESTIPALDAAINKGADLGVKEFVFGMAHRGRLNVLANIMGKSYEFIFSEFEANNKEILHTGGGDVKYHLGYSSIQKTPSDKEVYLKIMHNPSHLEAVAPVTLGYARAQADLRYDFDHSKICPIIIHGDAAVAGQGVVYETLQMANLDAYKTGGAIHFVINNQIGFTTDFEDARSSQYATSIARTLEAPVLHVNGDAPESVVYAMEFAMEFRQKFKTDIFIDMVCYRKHGHNEGDEPKFTQPHLYGLIAKTKNPRQMYIEYLSSRGEDFKLLAKEMKDEFKSMLSDRFDNVKDRNLPKKVQGPHTEWLDLRWSKPEDFQKTYKTGISKAAIKKIINTITTEPENFNTLKKAKKILNDRKNAFNEDKLDWGICELMAYGSLLLEKNNIRFTGQDVVRGTFSHRHSKLFDEQTNEAYCPLQNLEEGQGLFEIYNSHLSEYGVLGYEFGYSLASPKSLNIWEAQFGDFTNTAQVIIDQFITSCETKWERMSGLVMLLPHGYAGQGPEHSSARPERFLQQCADYNIIFTNITTPANFFHALRRQQAFEFRKPMINMSPKSLLRHPECISSAKDLETGYFQEVIDDDSAKANKVKRVLLCTGKIYYELMAKKKEDKRDDVAIVRVEQLYPLPMKQLREIEKKYECADEYFWVQEEPENMGYWSYLFSRFPDYFLEVGLISRVASATPATGYGLHHKQEQDDIIKKSFE